MKLAIATTTILSVLICSLAFAQEIPQGAQRVPGVFAQEDAGNLIVVVPESVRVGEEFQLTITTVGGGCDFAGDNGVIIGNRSASIHVYDFTTAARPGVACTAIFKQFRHNVTLSFQEAGVATIRIWGRQVGRYHPEGGAPVTLNVSINVTP
jgi:hypothetical protein